MRPLRIAFGAVALAGTTLVAAPHAFSQSSHAQAGASSDASSQQGQDGQSQEVPRYDHIVEIMMENHSYSEIIGNPAAPNLNALASRYGLATQYYGVTHPSEPNYVAAIGGDYFGIQDDNPFYCTPAMGSTDPTCAGTTVDHTVNQPNLATELTDAGKTWKGYFQSLPPVAPGQTVSSGPQANGVYSYKWPSGSYALYASKHDPFLNFTATQGQVSQQVPDTQLGADLLTGNLANYSLVVPDQCHDMHGTGGCSGDSVLIPAGDQYVASTVSEIMASPVWHRGNNAIVITWDENDFSTTGTTGCCSSNPGGGQVATIVIPNHSSGPVSDSTPYNHYSLLRTMEQAFGVPCLAHACDAAVQPMTRLFAVGDGAQNQNDQ